jgi:hypothetical protein
VLFLVILLVLSWQEPKVAREDQRSRVQMKLVSGASIFADLKVLLLLPPCGCADRQVEERDLGIY